MKLEFNTPTDLPFETMNERPWKIAKVANVVMIGLTRPFVIRSPLINPAKAPAVIAARIPTIALSNCTITVAATMEPSPTMEPTDTSIPPDIITMVCAIATIPRIVTAFRIADKLRVEKNASGLSVPKITIRIIRAASRLRFCAPIDDNKRFMLFGFSAVISIEFVSVMGDFLFKRDEALWHEG